MTALLSDILYITQRLIIDMSVLKVLILQATVYLALQTAFLTRVILFSV